MQPTLDPDTIRDHVWPGWMRDSAISRLCPCQYGLCGACAQGRHDRCLTSRIGPLYSDVYGYMVNHRGLVVASILWLPGQTPCEYRCPCPTPEPDDVPVSAHRRRPIRDVPLPEPAAPDQPALFDL